MEPQVMENSPPDEYDQIVFFFLLIAFVAIGSLPLALPGGWILSLMIWAITVSVLVIIYRSHDAKQIGFVRIGNDGVGLQLRKGDYRKVNWTQIRGVEPKYGAGDGRWLLLVFPFAFGKEEREEKQGLIILDDSSKYRVSWKIAEAILEGYREIVGEWPIPRSSAPRKTQRSTQ